MLGVRGGGWQLFDRRGRDRQDLVNVMLVAMRERRIRIHPSPHGDAMRRALLACRRVVGEDGDVGAELVIALALCAIARQPSVARIW